MLSNYGLFTRRGVFFLLLLMLLPLARSTAQYTSARSSLPGVVRSDPAETVRHPAAVSHASASVSSGCSTSSSTLALVPIKESEATTYVQSSLSLYEVLIEVDATYDEATNTLCYVQARGDVFEIDDSGSPTTAQGQVHVTLLGGQDPDHQVVASKTGSASTFVMTDPASRAGSNIHAQASFFAPDGATGEASGPLACVPPDLWNSSCDL